MTFLRSLQHVCKVLQQITGESCLSESITGSQSLLLSKAVWLLSQTFSILYMTNSIRLQMHPGINKHQTECSWRPGAQCSKWVWRTPVSKSNEKGLLDKPEEDQVGRREMEGNLKWIFKQFVRFCFVEDAPEGDFPSVLPSPWPLSAKLSHLSSCHWTSPLRPCQRLQRARPYHQSHTRRATPITTNDGRRSKLFWHTFLHFLFKEINFQTSSWMS